MKNALVAEWIKLRTTKALWWTTALFILFGVGLAVMVTQMTKSVAEPSTPEEALMVPPLDLGTVLSGVMGFGAILVLIQAVLVVTSEYGTDTIKSTLLGVPSRWPVAVAKVLVYAVLMVIVAAATMAAVITICSALLSSGPESLRDAVSWSDPDVGTVFVRMLVYVVLLVVLGVGVGFILRNTALAIALTLIWSQVGEGLITLLPKVGEKIAPYLPFRGMQDAIMMAEPWRAAWSPTGMILYFAAIAVGLWVVGLVLLMKRDA